MIRMLKGINYAPCDIDHLWLLVSLRIQRPNWRRSVARLPTIHIASINVAIQNRSFQKPDIYLKLMHSIYVAAAKVEVRSDTLVFMDYQEQIASEHAAFGSLARLTKLDPKRWYNIDLGKPATNEDRKRIQIPDELKPNYHEIRFWFDAKVHRLFFLAKAETNVISPISVLTYMREMMNLKAIRSLYGTVTVSLDQNKSKVSRILKLPDLQSLQIEINRPNVYSLNVDTIAFEEHLLANSAAKVTTTYEADDTGNLSPTRDVALLASLAAETGEVIATYKDPDTRVIKSISSLAKPMVEYIRLRINETIADALERGARAISKKLRNL